MNYTKTHEEEKGQAPLEPNHTEFIFIDDGSVRKYGGEIEFRANLEKSISGNFFAPRTTPSGSMPLEPLSSRASSTADLTGSHMYLFIAHGYLITLCLLIDTVPIVLLVVEGGPNTVRTGSKRHFFNRRPKTFIVLPFFYSP